ncbi:hypothetical protein ACFV1W_06160 [Kitasatospora sp. NPDC059648]|uniref:hypothetical protein n=1 Tax=Kitasatospora sp. NPDC059648 TaxID=3346894 RepID=UPI003690EB37
MLDDPGFSFWAGLHLGTTAVRSGPGDLWEAIEAAHRSWLDQNRPRREWFTLAADPDGRQVVGCTAPDGTSLRWEL